MLDTREAVLADNLQTDPEYSARDSINELKAGSLICVPVLTARRGSRAHPPVHGAPKQFSEDDLEYTLAVARQMAGAWAQLRHQAQLTNTNRALKESLALESENKTQLVGAAPAPWPSARRLMTGSDARRRRARGPGRRGPRDPRLGVGLGEAPHERGADDDAVGVVADLGRLVAGRDPQAHAHRQVGVLARSGHQRHRPPR